MSLGKSSSKYVIKEIVYDGHYASVIEWPGCLREK